MTQLPGIAGEIEEVIGLDAAVTLVRARGGTDIEIPKRAAGSYLEGLVGADAAAALISHFGHGRLGLPCAHLRGAGAERARRKARALEMLQAGRSQREVALACDLHLRTVERYARESPDRSRDGQGELPL